MKKAKLDKYMDTSTYDKEGLGEDFEEFKKQLAATETISEGDKNLFISLEKALLAVFTRSFDKSPFFANSPSGDAYPRTLID